MFSGVANLASDYDYSNLGSFRDMTFFWFFFFFKKKLIGNSSFSKFEIPNPVAGYSESIIRS